MCNLSFGTKSPIAINDLFKFSRRGQRSLFIITSPPNDSYVYRMSVIWNSVRTVLSCPDTSFPIPSIKTKLKVFLLNKAQSWALFVLFINDLPDHNIKHITKLFADDLNLIDRVTVKNDLLSLGQW